MDQVSHRPQSVSLSLFPLFDPDGMYANFAGRDASRGMAKQSFDEGLDY